MRLCALLGIVALIFAQGTFTFKAHDFKTCSQSGFCRRGRALSARATEARAQGASWVSPYSVDPASIRESDGGKARLTADVRSSLYPDIRFGLDVRIHEDGVVRVRMDEVGGLRKRYDETASWALIAEPTLRKDVKWVKGKKEIRTTYGGKKKDEVEVVVTYEPLKVSLLRGGKEQVVLNGQGLLHMEHFRQKVEPPPPAPEVEGEPQPATTEGQVPLKMAENPRLWFEGETEDAYWEETFSSWTDSKPKGRHLSNSYNTFHAHNLQSRSRISITRYQLPEPPSGLWNPPTRNKARSSFNQRREPNFRRPLQALQRRCVRISRFFTCISLRFHPTHACPLY